MTRRRLSAPAEEALLDTGDEAKARALGELSDRAEEVQVAHQLLLAVGAEVVEQLVEDEEQPLVGELGRERRHHGGEHVLVVLDLVLGRHLELHAVFSQLVLERLHDELPQRHRRVDLGADDEEAPGDQRGLVGHRGVGDRARELGMLRDGGDHGHEVRLAGAVVADDEEALVVRRRLELKLGEHEVRELLAHPIGDDEGLDEATSTGLAVGFAELNDGLDGVELDDVRVVHAECSWADVAPLLPGTSPLETMSA